MEDSNEYKQITQEDVDEVFLDIKAHWDSMVKESGKSEQMFIALGGSEVAHFMMHYQTAKEHVESLGLVMPELVEGLTIKLDSD